MKMRTPKIIPGESLSSWMIRISLLNACDMWTLSWKIREKGHLLTSDFERNLPAERIHQLSEASGRPYAEIDALLLIHSVRQHTVVLNTAGKIWPRPLQNTSLHLFADSRNPNTGFRLFPSPNTS